MSPGDVPTNSMPGWLQAVAEHQPLTYMINAIRNLAHGTGLDEDFGTTLTALVCTLGIATVGIATSALRVDR